MEIAKPPLATVKVLLLADNEMVVDKTAGVNVQIISRSLGNSDNYKKFSVKDYVSAVDKTLVGAWISRLVAERSIHLTLSVLESVTVYPLLKT